MGLKDKCIFQLRSMSWKKNTHKHVVQGAIEHDHNTRNDIGNSDSLRLGK